MSKKPIATLLGLGFGLKVVGIIFLILTILMAVPAHCIDGFCSSTEPDPMLILGSVTLLLIGLVLVQLAGSVR